MTLSLVAYLVLAIGACGQAPAQDGSPNTIDSSLPHWKNAERLSQILARDADLPKLTLSDDPMVAVHAAWRRVQKYVLSSKEERVGLSKVEHSPEYFLGVLEGRLKTSTPQWWKDVVASARRDGYGRLEFVVDTKYDGRDRVDRLVLPSGVKGKLQPNSDLLVTTQTGEFTIPKKCATRRSNSDALEIAVGRDGKAKILAWCGRNDYVDVMRISDDGEVWWTPVRGEWVGGDSSGPGYAQKVSLALSGKTVTVFAASPFVAYMEVLDLDSGACTFRFSTAALPTSK